MTLTASSRLAIGLLICRISVAIVFLAWAYDKLVKGSDGAGAKVMADFYYLPVPPDMVIRLIGAVQLIAVALLVLGLFKKPLRLFLLILALLPFALPGVWNGLYVGALETPHPTVLMWSATTLCACAFAIYKLRNYDTLASLGPRENVNSDATIGDGQSGKDLRLALFFCRLTVFIVYLIWVYAKIAWPERGSNMMKNFWLIPNFPQWGVIAFAWAELLICIAFVLGYFKRATGAFFVFLGVMAIFTPRALNGKWRVFNPDDSSWHTIMLFPAFCLLAAAILVYLMRDYDTKYTLAKPKT